MRACTSRLARGLTCVPAGDAFGALARGDVVCIAPRAIALARPSIVLNRLSVTHVHSTPAVWSTVGVREPFETLEVVALGGEKTAPALSDAWLSTGYQAYLTRRTT